MRSTLNIATASINTIALDIKHNVSLILKAYKDAIKDGADLVLTPELAITGYGLEDLFYLTSTIEKIPSIIKNLTKELDQDKYLAVGFPLLVDKKLHNAVALLTKDKVLGCYLKQNLSRTGINYEQRWFDSWPRGLTHVIDFADEQIKIGDLIFEIDDVKIGIEFTNDWQDKLSINSKSSLSVCDVILNPSASYFALEKNKERLSYILNLQKHTPCVYAYTNLLGCDSGKVIFDGEMIVASEGKLVAKSNSLSFKPYKVMSITCNIAANRSLSANLQDEIKKDANLLESEVIVFDNLKFAKNNKELNCQIEDTLDDYRYLASRAVSLGLWDWMRKTYTSGYALSLSGGADSALCLSLVYYSQLQALATLGLDDYLAVLSSCSIKFNDDEVKKFNDNPMIFIKDVVMPKVIITLYQGSDFSGDVTYNAAKNLANEVGALHNSWSISNLVKEYVRLADSLTPENLLTWEKDDLALQNIQARVRSPGIWLLANKYNKLLLATSNLSEATVGYCTMDGDTSGVLSPIGGIGKSKVLQINRYIFEEGLKIEENQVFKDDVMKLASMQGIISQAPTAELRPVEQTDEKDLMPYPLLDEIRFKIHNFNLTPKEVFIELLDGAFAQTYSKQFILDALRRFYRLYCRNQWKRERLACAFHIEKDSTDPKTFRRLPLLSSSLSFELSELNDYAKELGLN